tara:strand:+ start:51 stop:356 length:306 start_codon:yes stop_codon:yes gene_type:complete
VTTESHSPANLAKICYAIPGYGSTAGISPVSDGGYALMGLNAFHPSLFDDIPWSTEKVSELTLERFRILDWQVAHLKPLHDIDKPDDLQYLPEKFRFGLSV